MLLHYEVRFGTRFTTLGSLGIVLNGFLLGVEVG
jgi:hypothetical protein